MKADGNIVEQILNKLPTERADAFKQLHQVIIDNQASFLNLIANEALNPGEVPPCGRNDR